MGGGIDPRSPRIFGLGGEPGGERKGREIDSNTPDPKGSVDDGKRRTAVLEVGLSPPRAK